MGKEYGCKSGADPTVLAKNSPNTMRPETYKFTIAMLLAACAIQTVTILNQHKTLSNATVACVKANEALENNRVAYKATFDHTFALGAQIGFNVASKHGTSNDLADLMQAWNEGTIISAYKEWQQTQ